MTDEELAAIKARCEAHAREDVPALLAEVERLRAENARLQPVEPRRYDQSPGPSSGTAWQWDQVVTDSNELGDLTTTRRTQVTIRQLA